jgi:hypothetical protein
MQKPIFTAHPPYLRYDDPAQLAQIQAKLESARQASLARKPAPTPVSATAKAVARTRSNGPTQAGPSESVTGAVATQVVGADTPDPVADGRSAPAISITPGGTVALGFNCRVDITTVNNFQFVDTVNWFLAFKDPAGNFVTDEQFLATVPNWQFDINTMAFELDYDTYYRMAYAAKGAVTFRVRAESATWGIPGPFADSPPVTLDFSKPACIGLQSVRLDQDTFVGSKNNKEPTLTVTLAAPAPPGGQRVYLNTSDHSLGWFMGTLANNPHFDIPAGQTTGSISWFLGTKKVLVDRSFNIEATVNASTGYAGVNLTRK